MGGDGAASPAVGASAGIMRTVEAFDNLSKVGSGTYGDVFRATSKDTGLVVALKKIKMTQDQETDGFPITALREIKLLKQLKHKNVVDLMEIVMNSPSEANRGKGSIYMVFEFMDYDLTGLMEEYKRQNRRFSPAQVKGYMKQLLEGIFYVHSNSVLHRDIKCANLLINSRGELKLGDFGLARKFDKEKLENFTNKCITLWYRPPELLLGATRYSVAVDMWSIGCVFYELLTTKPLLAGKDEPHQLDLVCKLCGTPTEAVWPGVSKLPFYERMLGQPKRPPYARSLTRQLGPEVRDPMALSLLDMLLTLDPSPKSPNGPPTRIRASEALDHDYFWTPPTPLPPTPIPDYRARTHKQPAQQQPMRPPPPAGAGGGNAAGAFGRVGAQPTGGFTGGVPKRPFGSAPAPPGPAPPGPAGPSAEQGGGPPKVPRFQ